MSDAQGAVVPAGVRVRLFGPVRVEREGDEVVPPPGTPAAVLRVVAACGAVHVDELVEIIWPDAPQGAGRTRLRNVLSRLRTACGEVFMRVGDTVAIADGVEVDLAAFEALARRALALRPDDPSRACSAKQALAVHDGDLLPEDVYREWTAVVRERARRYRLALLDAVAEDAARRGDVEGAMRRWREATSIEPYDESRYVAMAELLVSAGRWGAASAVVARAEAALGRLGLSTSPALEQVRRTFADVTGTAAASRRR